MLHRMKVPFSPSEIHFVWSDWGKSGKEHRRHFCNYRCHRPDISSISAIDEKCVITKGRVTAAVAMSGLLRVMQFLQHQANLCCNSDMSHGTSNTTESSLSQAKLWHCPLNKAAVSVLPWPKRETVFFCSTDKYAERWQLSGYIKIYIKKIWIY